jgi:hypothetical protein
MTPGCNPLSQNLEGLAEHVPSFEDPCAPPVRLIGLQSIVCRFDPRAIGLPAVRAHIRFRIRATLARTDRSPSLAKRVHSLVSASPLRSYFARPPGPSFQSGLSCQGFVPLRGVTGGVHLAQELSDSHYVPSSGFLNLSTVCATFQRRGLIASRSHVQGFPFRGFSRSTGELVRRQPMPPCRLRRFARWLASCHVPTVRLRGLAPWTDAFRRVGN